MEGYTRNRLYLQELIQDLGPKLILLQEIWLAYSDFRVLSQDFPDYNFVISTPDMFENSEEVVLHAGHVWHGAAVAWHDDIAHAVTDIPVTNHRFAAALINFSSKLLVISLYAPTSTKDDEFEECLGFLEEFLLDHTPVGGAVLIGADSNCSSTSSNRRKYAWVQFWETFSLEIS